MVTRGPSLLSLSGMVERGMVERVYCDRPSLSYVGNWGF